MHDEFAVGGPYVYALWTDAELPEPSVEFAKFNEFYNDVHVPEVVRLNPGFRTGVRGGRRPPVGAGGFAAARYVALYGAAGEDAVSTYLRRTAPGSDDRPRYTSGAPYFPGPLRARGRGIYRRSLTLSAGAADSRTTRLVLTAHGIAATGDTAPAGAPEPDRDLLDRTMADGGFHRVSWYVLEHNLNGPDANSPHAMAVYEAGPDAPDPGEFAGGVPITYDVLCTRTVEDEPQLQQWRNA